MVLVRIHFEDGRHVTNCILHFRQEANCGNSEIFVVRNAPRAYHTFMMNTEYNNKVDSKFAYRYLSVFIGFYWFLLVFIVTLESFLFIRALHIRAALFASRSSLKSLNLWKQHLTLTWILWRTCGGAKSREDMASVAMLLTHFTAKKLFPCNGVASTCGAIWLCPDSQALPAQISSLDVYYFTSFSHYFHRVPLIHSLPMRSPTR